MCFGTAQKMSAPSGALNTPEQQQAPNVGKATAKKAAAACVGAKAKARGTPLVFVVHRGLHGAGRITDATHHRRDASPTRRITDATPFLQQVGKLGFMEGTIKGKSGRKRNKSGRKIRTTEEFEHLSKTALGAKSS